MDDKLRAAAQAVLDKSVPDNAGWPYFRGVPLKEFRALQSALHPEEPLMINGLTVEQRITSVEQAPLDTVETRAAVADHLRELYAEYAKLQAENKQMKLECIRLRAEVLELKKKQTGPSIIGPANACYTWNGEGKFPDTLAAILMLPDKLRAIIEERDRFSAELNKLRELSWYVISESRWDEEKEKFIVTEETAWNRLRNFLHPTGKDSP
jgi:regulator of replication initiation timing